VQRQLISLLVNHRPEIRWGEGTCVEGFSPAALGTHLIRCQEVTETHLLADVPEHGLFGCPGGRSRDEPCGLHERPSVPDVPVDPLITAADPDLDRVQSGMVKDIHHGGIGQIEAVTGAVTAAAFAAADLV
jgi:hypothetical protein